MSYSAEISRTNPSCFLFLIDQSGSMADPFPDTGKTKANGVADAINRVLQDLVVMCSKGEEIRDYYDISVIGYGAQVGPAFGGKLSGRDIVSISEVAENPARLEERTQKVQDGVGGLVDQIIKFPIWFDAIANGGTPMCQALSLAESILGRWLEEHPSAFPPVVFHITDGESTDGDPTEYLNSIGDLCSSDGNVLLFNLHLSSNRGARAVVFPSSPEGLPDQYSRMLFDSASPLTTFMLSTARGYDYDLADGARGFALNGDMRVVISGLSIGTRPSNLR